MNLNQERKSKFPTKAYEIKKKTKKLLAECSTHGLSNYFRTDHYVMKLMWLIFFLTSCCGCGYFIAKTIANFTSYEVITNINVFTEKESQFPSVSICSRDSYNFTNLSEIHYCILNFDDSCQTSPHKYFELFDDPHYGLCYRFNSGKDAYGNKIDILNVSYAGKENGFIIDFKIDASKDFSKLVVYVHNHTDIPYSLYNKGIELYPGAYSFLSVDRIFTQKLGYPYNDCLKDPNSFAKNKTLIDFIAKSNRSYSQKVCFDLCFNLHYIIHNDCNCTADLDKISEKCYANYEVYEKTWNCTRSFRNNFTRKFFMKCYDYCPLECDSITYNVNSFNLVFPSSGNVSERDKNLWFDNIYSNYEEVHKSFYSLAVYYEDIKYTLISEQEKMSAADFASNIGGLIGVFMGSSFLSFFEFFEMIFYIVNGLSKTS